MSYPTLNTILNKTPEPLYKDKIILKNQDTKDIITELLKSHKLYYAQACTIANDFKGKDIKQTAKNIHNFLKNYSDYNIEDINEQTSKSIYRYLHDNLQGDCKHQSLFTTAVLKCLYPDAPIYFRFTSYKLLDSEPSHVYSVIVDEYGKDISVDPLQEFNTEKFYFSHIDKKLPSMLSRLSGIGQVSTVNAISGVNWVAKVPLAIPRNAYLLLIKLNVARIGSRVREAMIKNPSALKDKWEKLGGSYSSLTNAAKNVSDAKISVTDISKLPVGSSARDAACEEKYAKIGLNRGKCKKGKINGSGAVGEVATATAGAAALAAAAPIIVAMTGLFKQLGIGVDTELQAVTDNAGDNLTNPDYDPNEDPDFTFNGNGANGANGSENGENFLTGETAGIPNVALLGGAGILALILLTK